MGGVDLSDMLIELYRTDIRSKKWYMRIVYYCFDLAVVNAWLLYRRHMIQHKENKFLRLKDFRCSIALALCKAGKGSKKRRGRPSLEDNSKSKKRQKTAAPQPIYDVRYDEIGHWPATGEKKQRCKYCPKGYTRIYCCKCMVGLCLNKNNNCFKQYHCK